jgi:hypothetical protein
VISTGSRVPNAKEWARQNAEQGLDMLGEDIFILT